MKVFAISDLHLSLNNPKPMDIFGPVWEGYLDKIFSDWKEMVGSDDIVLMAGDFSWAMKLEDAVDDFKLLEFLPGKKIIIKGNHDYWWKSISAVRGILPQGFYALQNDAIKFGNVVVCGTRGWATPEKNMSQTPEDEKIYKREILRLEMSLEAANKLREEGDKVLCMMHYPPFNFTRENSPFSNLIEKYNVDSVIFGHIHGYKNIQLEFEKNNIKYFLTSCDMVKNNIVRVL